MTTLKIIDGNRSEIEREALYDVALGKKSAEEAGEPLTSKGKLKLHSFDAPESSQLPDDS